MHDKQLRAQLIRLAHSKPELRAEILPLLASSSRQAGCEKLPEGGMRDNCEEKRDEGKDKAKGADKKAHGPVSLRDPDVMLYLIDKEANSSKFYEMKVVPSSGGYILQRRWGRLTDSGSAGRVDSMDTPFGDEASAMRMMLGFKTEKMRKGYKEARGQYPIGLGGAGFGWGGQVACAYIPELKQMAANVSKATADLTAVAPTLANLARRESGMAKGIAEVYTGALAGLSKLDKYLEQQLSAC